jgi:hypothetical protein
MRPSICICCFHSVSWHSAKKMVARKTTYLQFSLFWGCLRKHILPRSIQTDKYEILAQNHWNSCQKIIFAGNKLSTRKWKNTVLSTFRYYWLKTLAIIFCCWKILFLYHSSTFCKFESQTRRDRLKKSKNRDSL